MRILADTKRKRPVQGAGASDLEDGSESTRSCSAVAAETKKVRFGGRPDEDDAMLSDREDSTEVMDKVTLMIYIWHMY